MKRVGFGRLDLNSRMFEEIGFMQIVVNLILLQVNIRQVIKESLVCGGQCWEFQFHAFSDFLSLCQKRYLFVCVK